MQQGRYLTHRPKIPVQPQAFSDVQQPFLGSQIRRVGIPLGATDRTQQDRVAGPAGKESALWQRDAEAVQRIASDRFILQSHVHSGLSCDLFQHRNRRLDYLRADPVPGQHTDAVNSRHPTP